ncbi:hypothetical protein B0G77_7243 [Paraburkholderia sp. BL10I2N1]|nr:hypothetical protein B0G77_7243 [Paraburkholderia sp. BL10I2N1]
MRLLQAGALSGADTASAGCIVVALIYKKKAAKQRRQFTRRGFENEGIALTSTLDSNPNQRVSSL